MSRKAEQAAALEAMRQSLGISGVVKKTGTKAQEDREVPEAQDVLEAQEALQTQGRAGMKASRINMAFRPSNLEYLRKIAGIEGVSITAYVNRLIDADRQARQEALDRALSIIR